MKLNEKFFEIIYNIVIQQNIVLLKTIAEREKIPYHELYDMIIKNHRSQFSSFISSSP